jgi:hypothetical protein
MLSPSSGAILKTRESLYSRAIPLFYLGDPFGAMRKRDKCFNIGDFGHVYSVGG